MMNVVKTDITGEPLENFRQFIEGTPFERGLGVVPVLATLPVNTLELMLDVEQPDPRGSGYGRDDELKEKIRFESKNKAQNGRHSKNREIHPVNGVALTFAGFGRGNALADQVEVKRRDDKEDKWISYEAVAQAL